MPDYTGGQFPSLDGDPAAEVAQRTEPDTEGSWFRKVFTVHNRAHTTGLPEDHEVHRNNFVAVLQAALQQGLHPKAAPELESEEPHSFDPNHTDLTYRVHVVPAVTDRDPNSTVTPSTLALVQADPDALEQPPAEPEPGGTSRWERGEGGVDEHGVPLVPPQPSETTKTPAPTEEPPAVPEAPEEPTEG